MSAERTFPRFGAFPVEIQRLVWDFATAAALESSGPGVCGFPQVLAMSKEIRGRSHLYVERPWPVLAYACREARAATMDALERNPDWRLSPRDGAAQIAAPESTEIPLSLLRLASEQPALRRDWEEADAMIDVETTREIVVNGTNALTEGDGSANRGNGNAVRGFYVPERVFDYAIDALYVPRRGNSYFRAFVAANADFRHRAARPADTADDTDTSLHPTAQLPPPDSGHDRWWYLWPHLWSVQNLALELSPFEFFRCLGPAHPHGGIVTQFPMLRMVNLVVSSPQQAARCSLYDGAAWIRHTAALDDIRGIDDAMIRKEFRAQTYRLETVPENGVVWANGAAGLRDLMASDLIEEMESQMWVAEMDEYSPWDSVTGDVLVKWQVARLAVGAGENRG